MGEILTGEAHTVYLLEHITRWIVLRGGGFLLPVEGHSHRHTGESRSVICGAPSDQLKVNADFSIRVHHTMFDYHAPNAILAFIQLLTLLRKQQATLASTPTLLLLEEERGATPEV